MFMSCCIHTQIIVVDSFHSVVSSSCRQNSRSLLNCQFVYNLATFVARRCSYSELLSHRYHRSKGLHYLTVVCVAVALVSSTKLLHCCLTQSYCTVLLSRALLTASMLSLDLKSAALYLYASINVLCVTICVYIRQ